MLQDCCKVGNTMSTGMEVGNTMSTGMEVGNTMSTGMEVGNTMSTGMAEASAATTIHERRAIAVYSSGGACLRHADLATALTPCSTVFLRPAIGPPLWSGSSHRPALRRYVQAARPLSAPEPA